MYDYTYEEFGTTGEYAAAEGLGIFLVVWLLIFLLGNGWTILQYILSATGTYTIAKRRGIRNPWLAWIPGIGAWTLGCISDQYQYVVRGNVRNKRIALLILNVLVSVILFALAIFFFAFMFQAFTMPEGGMESPGQVATVVGSMFGIIAAALLIPGLVIAESVIRFITLYDLYSSCEPSNNVLYLLLSIFIGITAPFLVFICRNKDLGMPPRKLNPKPETYRPQSPEIDPWDRKDNE